MLDPRLEVQVANILFSRQRAYGVSEDGLPATLAQWRPEIDGWQKKMRPAVTAALRTAASLMEDGNAVTQVRASLMRVLETPTERQYFFQLLREGASDAAARILTEKTFEKQEQLNQVRRILFEHKESSNPGNEQSTIDLSFPKAVPYFKRMVNPIEAVQKKISAWADNAESEHLICRAILTILGNDSRCYSFFHALDRGDEKEAGEHLHRVIMSLTLPTYPGSSTIPNDTLEPGTRIGDDGKISIAAGSAVRKRYGSHRQVSHPA